ncbi:Neural proliferation differentiation and control protein 1 [Camponotus floridanus]|uniref:Neural proliferation differentiation and control protein 1 n=1 Tax=Camponotus floridanus TaxID=104421 RepID=E2AZT2_CAMFO|nr:uncharacterized protein LOC105257767 [Camponotus floridanus]EFN61061.1 Neural proliferation differentiation and control protein 1 [Camponotus floridanus]
MLLRRGCTWLTLMPLLLSLSIGELSFYRNALPETSSMSDDIALKHLIHYLEAHRLQQRLHRSHLTTFLSPVHKKHSDFQQLNRQEERLIEYLTDRKAAEESLNQKLNAWLKHYYHPPNYHDSIADQIVKQNSEYFRNLDHKYSDYPEEKQPDEMNSNGHFSKDLEYRQTFNVDRGRAMDESVVDTFHKYIDHNPAGISWHHEGGRKTARPTEATEPEFTYEFDNSNLEEKHPFAVAPNDPRYYDKAPFSSDDVNRQEEEAVKKESIMIKHEDDIRNIDQTPKELIVRLDTGSKSDRSEGYHPLIEPMNYNLNNDIYFIAIVAGCSAAAMFALVLISLTWCRLQRGAKAAADIEYPAYGVTGPNKDVSPSGDQRLAQSAQMYHFQHQKQQIIAMENRTSATRDPGSLSEAESDEENEEGDYTVYECPGLASTGEMEVKNPMFHDDPTPATPAVQSNNKEEDHI